MDHAESWESRAVETEGSGDRLASDDVEELGPSLDEQQDRYLRLLADFENFRRRMAREHERARHEGRREALLALLPALDTLERALAAGSTDTPFYEGVVATNRLFLDALRELGVEAVQSEGQSFDPNQHEAVATVPAEDVEPGTVTREVRRGWRFGHELLRPAQVVVAARPEIAEPWR
jgi:molecular chaperone GrpE